MLPTKTENDVTFDAREINFAQARNQFCKESFAYCQSLLNSMSVLDDADLCDLAKKLIEFRSRQTSKPRYIGLFSKDL